MDGCARGNGQGGQAIKDPLAFGDKTAQLSGLRLLEQRFEIGTGDKNRLLGRDDDDATQRLVPFDRLHMLPQFLHGGGIENIGARFRAIEGQQANAILGGFPSNHGTFHGARRGHAVVDFRTNSNLRALTARGNIIADSSTSPLITSR